MKRMPEYRKGTWPELAWNFQHVTPLSPQSKPAQVSGDIFGHNWVQIRVFPNPTGYMLTSIRRLFHGDHVIPISCHGVRISPILLIEYYEFVASWARGEVDLPNLSYASHTRGAVSLRSTGPRLDPLVWLLYHLVASTQTDSQLR
jgi:hypothetical protein